MRKSSDCPPSGLEPSLRNGPRALHFLNQTSTGEGEACCRNRRKKRRNNPAAGLQSFSITNAIEFSVHFPSLFAIPIILRSRAGADPRNYSKTTSLENRPMRQAPYGAPTPAQPISDGAPLTPQFTCQSMAQVGPPTVGCFSPSVPQQECPRFHRREGVDRQDAGTNCTALGGGRNIDYVELRR
jgi:hypothetical protein